MFNSFSPHVDRGAKQKLASNDRGGANVHPETRGLRPFCISPHGLSHTLLGLTNYHHMCS